MMVNTYTLLQWANGVFGDWLGQLKLDKPLGGQIRRAIKTIKTMLFKVKTHCFVGL
jgi:hypothetical protein